MLHVAQLKANVDGIIRHVAILLSVIIVFLSVNVSIAQVNTGGTATTANHQKQVIGYLSNWDAWKAANAGLPAQGALNHLNIDYGKYTIINYSFFGVASDGSLHSGDLRNKNIYQSGQTQAPGDIFYVDPYSSWDLHLLFGELELIQHLNADAVAKATAQGFQVVENGSTWSHPAWGLFNKALPVPIHKPGGAPGVLELAHSKGVKVMASIGGWSMCKHFPEMAADPAKRQRFINDCVKLINTGFDGIDLDWEYPGPYGGMNFTGTQADFANFSNLVQEIRNAIGPNKLITAAMSADPVKLQGFEWNKISLTMNYFNFMTYDFNGGWSNKAGHNSPLYNYDNSEAPTFNWKSTYDALISYGVPKNKINMGSPFYGRGVVTSAPATLNGATLKRSENVQPDGPITTCADFTNWAKDVYDGTPLYFYIKQVALGAGSGWTRGWDNQAKVPYLTKGNYFLSYDDEESIGHKAQFIVDNQLAGTIIWTVFGDLELSGSPTTFGTKLLRYPTVKSVLVNKINEVFAGGSTGLPVVSITSPANGANFATGASVTINATASDTGGSIAKVEFLQNGAKIGEDATSPYSFTIASIAAGSHQITARAIDNSNNQATASINISAGSNQPPTAAITSPAGGATFTAPASVCIQVNATDNGGSVVKVEFYQGSTKLGEDATSPYEYCWTNVAAGTYSITAKSTDNGGLSTTSAAVTITVNPDGGGSCSGIPQYVNGSTYATGAQVKNVNKKFQCKVGGWCSLGGAYEPGVGWAWSDAWTDQGACTGGNSNPTVSIGSPANNQTFPAPANITINATATDSDGTIAKVEFFNGATKLGEDASSPYSFTWNNVTAGSYSLTAKATDNAGGTSTSTAVTVNVSSNPPPTVSITSPANNSSFISPANITISANASDNVSVAKVEFFNGSTRLGEDATSPYSYAWNNVGNGTYSVIARATDNQGAITNSSAITITVSSNTPPAVNITSPSNNASFAAPATISIAVNATDNGSVAKVEFYNGATKLGEDAVSPYSFSWASVVAGTYSITAKATDNLGLTSTSAAVNVTVTGGGCSYPQYVENGGYVAGSIVKNGTSSYKCKPHPYTGWCNGAAWAYAPGTGQYWQDAWTLNGSCGGRLGEEVNAIDLDEDELIFYPNPGEAGNRNVLTFTFKSKAGDVQVKLKDINGADVFSEGYKDVQDKLSVQLPVMSRGMYFIKVENKKTSWLKKYIIH